MPIFAKKLCREALLLMLIAVLLLPQLVVAESIDTTSVRFEAPDVVEGGLSLVASGTGDCQYQVETYDGKQVLNVKEYAYFTLLNTAVLQSAALTFTVELAETTSKSVLFQYCSAQNAYQTVDLPCYKSGDFVTITFSVTDADMWNNSQNSGAKFRVGKCKIRSITVTVGATDTEAVIRSEPPEFAPQTEQNNLIGKGVAGYQMWFGTGETAADWSMWSPWGNPQKGAVSIENYPYVQDYIDNGATLSQSNLADLGNGQKSLLYDGSDPVVIDTHFEWIKEAGVDGLAVQRFYSATTLTTTTAKTKLDYVRESAEKHGRIFYVMYDFSYAGQHDPEEFLERVKLDWIYNIEKRGIVTSTAYAHADGKPVVCMWGMSTYEAGDNYFYGETATALIRWFKERGYYVIGGAANNTYQTAGEKSLQPYTEIDMFSPWTPGRFNSGDISWWFQHRVLWDIEFCEQYGIEYQPVIHPGFSWANVYTAAKENDVARNAGEFMWRQGYLLETLGVKTCYFAMFDEINEGTAINKIAADYFEIPTDQYFVTGARDGRWLSNDFYLRCAGAIIDLLNGEIESDPNCPVAHSEGPVYWRNSFEMREKPVTQNGVTANVLKPVDVCLYQNEALISNGVTLNRAELLSVSAKSGKYSLVLTGTAEKNSLLVYRIATTAIAADKLLTLSYSLNLGSGSTSGVYVDLLFDDRTLLSDAMPEIKETDAQAQTWCDVSFDLKGATLGKQITAVLVCYAGAEGEFSACVDDIILQQSEDQSLPGTLGDVNGDDKVDSTDARMTLQYFVGALFEDDLSLTAADVNGDSKVDSTDARLILQYFVGTIQAFPAA